MKSTILRLVRETAIAPKLEMYFFHCESCLVFMVVFGLFCNRGLFASSFCLSLGVVVMLTFQG